MFCRGDSAADLNKRFVSCSGCQSIYHGDCVRPKLKGVCIDALLAADSGVRWFCDECKRFSSASLLGKLRNFEKTFVKLSSALEDLNQQFKIHGSDYLSLLDLCDQAVQAPKRSNIKMKKKKKMKSGSTSYKSMNSDSDVSYITPKTRLLKPVTKINNWRLSLFDTTTDNLGTGSLCEASVVENSGLSVLPKDKPPLIHEPSAVDVAVSSPNDNNDNYPIVGLDASLDWSVDVRREWLYVSRLKTSVTSAQLINFAADKLNIDRSRLQCHMLIKKDVDLSVLEFVSFKLGIPKFCYDVLKDPSFWPKGVLVKSFRDFSKNRPRAKKQLPS